MVPHAPTSARAVRRQLVGELGSRGLSGSLLAEASLVVTELLANALRHARPLPGGCLRASWLFDHDCLIITVTDGGSETTPNALQQGATGEGGRGLAIVDALAAEWGVDDEDGRTSVWAALPVRRPAGGLD